MTIRAFGQVTFTNAEVKQLAEQNLERKKCFELNSLYEIQIDSLNTQIETINLKVNLQNETILNYQNILDAMSKIDSVRVDQIDSYKETEKQHAETIQKQQNKLTFWRIFTPITVTAVAIFSIFK
jgi:hypothetical protein